MTQRDESFAVEGDEAVGFGLKDAVAALRRFWWLIVVLTGLGGGAAALIAISTPNRYEAIATVQIDPRKKTIVSLDAVLPDITGDTPTIESQVEIVHSRAIALRVIESLGLRNDKEFKAEPGIIGSLVKRLTGAGDGERGVVDGIKKIMADRASRQINGPPASGADDTDRDDVAAMFLDRLRTVRVRNTLVVEIRFAARDPVKAAKIVNAVADAYIREQVDTKIRATELASELLDKKISGLRDQVAEAEYRVARFKSSNGIFDAGTELLSEKQLSRLMEQTVAARNTAAEAKARYEQLQEMRRSGEGKNIAEVLHNNTITILKDQLGKATRREAELITKYGPKHPELIKARAELADVSDQLAHEIEQIVANVKNEFKVASDRERLLNESLGQLKQAQSVSKEVSIKLRELEREAESLRRVYETFLGRYKQTKETLTLQLPDSRVIEHALAPGFPSGPKRKLITCGGLILGFSGGLVIAILLQFMASGLARPEDAETTLGVPHLASIPELTRHGNGMTDPALSVRLMLAQPDGPFALAVMRLMSELNARRRDASPRIVLVASSLPNEGKTVIAANLALALAASGVRTLLIDADFRRSALTQQLGLAGTPGLLDAVGLGQDFESVVLRDRTSGLAVIAAGDNQHVALSPTEVLEAPGFGQRLARLKAHFDTILIDAPPILPVVDGRIVADYTDQIVFVAAWRRTPKDMVRRAVAQLGANAAKIVGLVINQVHPASGPASGVGVGRSDPRRNLRAA